MLRPGTKMSDASTRKISPLMIAPPLIFAALAIVWFFIMCIACCCDK